MKERRATIRRAADRELQAQVARLGEAGEGTEDKKRQRRHAIRHSCHALIELEMGMGQLGGENWKVSRTQIKGRVLDLSESGASVFLPHALAVGQPFKLTIMLFDGKSIETLAETRWTKTIEAKGGFAIGAHFTHLAPAHANAIRKFLSELDATAGL